MKIKIVKISIFVCIFYLIFSLFSCNSAFKTLEKIRSENEVYDNLDYIFTIEADEVIFDLIIADSRFSIVMLESDSDTSKPLYKPSSIASYAIEEHIAQFINNQNYNWSYSSKLSEHNYKWCIVTEEFNSKNEKFDCYKFKYNDVEYCLCFEI